MELGVGAGLPFEVFGSVPLTGVLFKNEIKKARDLIKEKYSKEIEDVDFQKQNTVELKEYYMIQVAATKQNGDLKELQKIYKFNTFIKVNDNEWNRYFINYKFDNYNEAKTYKDKLNSNDLFIQMFNEDGQIV